jgi:hypothetical protein
MIFVRHITVFIKGHGLSITEKPKAQEAWKKVDPAKNETGPDYDGRVS